MDKIGRFEIVGKLGRGAFGMVYKGRDPVINRLSAIKVMSEATVGDPELVARFKREAEAAGGLNHPNIVTIYDLGEHGGLPYIAMEFLEGDDLEKMLKEHREVPVDAKVQIMLQVAEGLHYAHTKGIVHRDIKPANIRILDDATVKIMDFGIAKMSSSDMTRTGQFMGTVNYMSPEQIKAKKIDGRSDLFALGILFYEMLTFRRPFPGDSITAVIYKIVNENPPAMKELHDTPYDWLESVVLKCLEKDPDKRWASCKEFADALRSRARTEVSGDLSNIDQTLVLARKQANDGDIDAALAKLDSILEQDPENTSVLKTKRSFEAMRIARRAESLISSGRLEQARDELIRAQEKMGENEELAVALATVKDQIKSHQADELFDEATRNLEGKRYEPGIQLLRQALTIDPYNEKAKSALARAEQDRVAFDVAALVADARSQLEQGHLDVARKRAQQALQLDDHSHEARSLVQSIDREAKATATRSRVEQTLFQAKLAIKKEGFDEAIGLAEKALKLDPRSAEARAVLDEAKSSKLIADEKRTLLKHIAKGKKLLDAKRFGEARSAFERALKLDGNWEEAKLGLQAARAHKRSLATSTAKKSPVGMVSVAVLLIGAAVTGWVLTRPSDASVAVAQGDSAVALSTIAGLEAAYQSYYDAAETLEGKDPEHRLARERFAGLVEPFIEKGAPLKAKEVLDQVSRWQGIRSGLSNLLRRRLRPRR